MIKGNKKGSPLQPKTLLTLNLIPRQDGRYSLERSAHQGAQRGQAPLRPEKNLKKSLMCE